MKGPLAGLYLRLSREDEKDSESQSIQNQREFLLDYCGKNSIAVVDIYIDDGYTGTNFNRPAFLRLLSDIEEKRVNLVLTKDLSRLGRDYILTGYYLERYFPERQVRYVAVNDGIDTAAELGESDMTPFRAVFNDLYAKDISKKVRTAFRTKQRQGKFTGTYAPYGYWKDPADKNHLLIDPVQAVYVRRIYELFLSGETISGIAARLTREGIPTPSQSKGLDRTRRKDSGSWGYTMVRRILTMPTYQGDMVSHMAQKVSYKVDKVVKLPPEEWTVVPGTHEGIIPREQFAQAQQMLGIRNYTVRASGAKPATGLIFCGGCGAPMTLWSNGKRRYFVCSTWKKAPAKQLCKAHYIREDAALAAVQSVCRLLIHGFIRRDSLLDAAESRQTGTLEALAQRAKTNKELSEKALFDLYKDKSRGVVSGEEFEFLAARLRQEAKETGKSYEALSEEVRGRESPDRLEVLFKGLLAGDTPDRGLLLRLVERLVVDDRQRLTIQFSFQSPY